MRSDPPTLGHDLLSTFMNSIHLNGTQMTVIPYILLSRSILVEFQDSFDVDMLWIRKKLYQWGSCMCVREREKESGKKGCEKENIFAWIVRVCDVCGRRWVYKFRYEFYVIFIYFVIYTLLSWVQCYDLVNVWSFRE